MINKIKSIFEYIIIFSIIFLIIFIFRAYVFQTVEVHGQSMYPTFIGTDENGTQKGEILFLSRLPYILEEPNRFDIVVFPLKEKNKLLIKRIIGLPGETIQIQDGYIYINGEILKENYGYETILDAGIAKETITLGEDEYFVLGDNRNNSMDSRDELVGTINKNEIIGKVLFQKEKDSN